MVYVGRGDVEIGNQAGPAPAQMDAETVKGWAGYAVPSAGGFPAEPLAAIGPGEPADGHGETVHHRQGRVMREGIQEHLPDRFLDPPEIGGLAREGGAANLGQSRKKVDIALAEAPIP